MELLRYQLVELSAAEISGPEEDNALEAEEERLARAAAHRAAAEGLYESLSGDEQLLDQLGRAVAKLAGHGPLDDLHERLKSLVAELGEVASEARSMSEALEEDPERLAEVVVRRALLRELRRKYAGPTGNLADVMAFQVETSKRLEELEALKGGSARLAEDRAKALAELRRAATELGGARRAAVPALSEGVERGLQRLAMPRARFEVRVGKAAPGPGSSAELADEENDDLLEKAGEHVIFLLAANPGEPLMPMSKVASGGELARAMLALRLVLVGASSAEAEPPHAEAAQGPSTLVFDEVDAGVGGEAALAVGRALAELGRRYQVIVVTHLAQVAAFADAQIAVSKVERDGRSIALAVPVVGQERIVELSRMLSGQPDSTIARRHARELLRAARSSMSG
jgi:DNA repair protein RecN (Recombination protein N)